MLQLVVRGSMYFATSIKSTEKKSKNGLNGNIIKFRIHTKLEKTF